MYQALYRKYRPRSFSDVTGQGHITETLRRQIINGRLSHAYLFVGTRGTGKTTCAKILSRAVNCLDLKDGNPCNKCVSCTGIEEGSILDVLELDAASNNSVDNVRALRDEAIYSPVSVKKRVYIVDEVHMLSLSAFNALLKILEEPPEHILFILATTELHKVPATIQSRCQMFSFKRLSKGAIAGRLGVIAAGEGLTLTADATEKLAMLADGSMRDGVSLLDQCATSTLIDLQHVQDTLGLAGRQELMLLAFAITRRDTATALGILDTLYGDGKDMASLLNELIGLVRDLLVNKIAPESALISSGASRAELSDLLKSITPERLFYCLEVIKDTLFGLSRGGSSKLAAEMCLIRLCDERLSDDVKALLPRISRLEEGGLLNVACRMQNVESDAEDVKEVRNAPSLTKQETSDATPFAIDVVTSPFIELLGTHVPAASTEQTDTLLPTEPTEQPDTHVPAASTDQPDSHIPTASTDYWTDIINNLGDHPNVRALLSDSSKVRVRQDDNVLIINIADSFNAGMIEEEYLELLKEAAKNALGYNVMIRVEAGVGKIEEEKRLDQNEQRPQSEHRSLDSLSAFDIVNFE